jgi:hypothetical protein
MIPEERDSLDGQLEPAMDELPEGLDVIREIERAVLKIRPPGIGGPRGSGEKD